MMLSAASEELPLKNEQRAIFASDSIKAFKASGDENFRYVLMANLLVLKYAKQCSSRYLEALSLYQENKSAMIDKLDKDFHDELKDRYEAVISTSDCDPKPQADSLRR